MEKKRTRVATPLFEKTVSEKNEHFENILLLNVLLMHHQSASDHALDSVEHHLFSFEESFSLKRLRKGTL